MATIRNACAKDLSGILRVHVEQFKAIGETARKARPAFDTAMKSKCLFVAEGDDGKTVGYASVALRGKSAYLCWIAVNQRSQGNGLGAALLDHVRQWAIKNRVKHIELDSRNRFKKALMMYLRANYDIVGLWRHTDGELMLQLRLTLKD